MFERFTTRARQVVLLAREEALHLRHCNIDTEHLLLGLLRERESVASQVLRARGLTADGVRDALVRIGARGTDRLMPSPDPFQLAALAPSAARALELALREALSLGDNYIATEHLLLGLLRQQEGLAVRVLEELDVRVETIRTDVSRRRSDASAGGRPAASG